MIQKLRAIERNDLVEAVTNKLIATSMILK